MNIHDFSKLKQKGQKISVVTCYDYTFARILEETDIHCVLVGDSLAMVMHGADNTIAATLDLMKIHTSAVAKGIKTKFIVTDLPFLAHRKSLSETMAAVETLVRAGAEAIKIEGAEGNLETIRYIVESGIPVMGHLGLNAQHMHQLGGFKVQGKDQASQDKLLEHAKQLEKAGCFSLVLECMPPSIGKKISESLHIPTIGIGAGSDTDGQVLVLQDLLGLFQSKFKPKFVKCFLDGEQLVKQSINQFAKEVSEQVFPEDLHAY